MKKVLFCLTSLFLSCLLYGQEQDHLRFKSIPIDGPLETFATSMSNLGLSKKGSDGEIAVLSGNFAGYKDCTFIVAAFESNVWKVIVEFPERKTWASTKELYDRLKESFITKYDVTPVCVEKLPHYAKPGTGLEHLAFQDETGKWQSTFDLWNGRIRLFIKGGELSTKQMKVVLEYQDGINAAIVEGSAMEDL